MEIYLKKTLSGLKPLYDSDADQLAKIKIGEDVLATIKRPRNLRFHKKFFALLNLGFQNQDRYADFETFRFVMIMKAGFYVEIETGKGAVFMPRSISFANMDESEFEQVYKAMRTQVEILVGVSGDEIDAEINSFY